MPHCCIFNLYVRKRFYISIHHWSSISGSNGTKDSIYSSAKSIFNHLQDHPGSLRASTMCGVEYWPFVSLSVIHPHSLLLLILLYLSLLCSNDNVYVLYWSERFTPVRFRIVIDFHGVYWGVHCGVHVCIVYHCSLGNDKSLWYQKHLSTNDLPLSKRTVKSTLEHSFK